MIGLLKFLAAFEMPFCSLSGATPMLKTDHRFLHEHLDDVVQTRRSAIYSFGGIVGAFALGLRRCGIVREYSWRMHNCRQCQSQ